MGITGRGSRKKWLQAEHRRYRAYERDMIAHERYDDIQDFTGKYGNEWSSPRDGLSYFGYMENRRCNPLNPYRYMFDYTPEAVCRHYFCHIAYKEYMRK